MDAETKQIYRNQTMYEIAIKNIKKELKQIDKEEK